MADQVVYTDPLGNKLVYEEDGGVYVVEYPPRFPGDDTEVEELPFQVGDPANGVNGTSNELLVEAVIHRLKRLEDKKPSIFNRLVIRLLDTAVTFLEKKTRDEMLNEQFKDIKLTEGDLNALEVVRWGAVVDGIETVTKGLNDILTKTYRNGSKMRAVDIRRIKHPEIVKLFQNRE